MTAFACRSYRHRTIVARDTIHYVCACHTGGFRSAPAGRVVLESLILAEWLACAECARLVRAGDAEGLAERAGRAYAARHPDAATDTAIEAAACFHAGYWLHRVRREN